MRLAPHNDRGVVAIEFVLVFPFLLIILFGVIVLGGLLGTYNRTLGAARDGARAAALSQPIASPAEITVTRTSAACPPRTDPAFNTANVVVEAKSVYSSLSVIGMGNRTITETVTMRCGS